MLILLDIDGVLVPANSWRKPELMEDGFPVFSLKSVQALQRILSETNASVVLTSSHKTTYDLPQWKKMFQSRGLEPKHLTKLDSNTLEMTRKDEILEWYRNKHVIAEDFVIIDDDKMLNSLPDDLKSNLVLTSSSLGLTEELADDAISILQKRPIHLQSRE